MEFNPYPKTPRLKRDMVITEKLDGTNAQVVIVYTHNLHDTSNVVAASADDTMRMLVGSRSRWITPGKNTDNYGFAGWCQANAEELFKLGEGQHFGEWYGNGIQRGYGLLEKRFALFNSARWGKHNPNTPSCCEVVPVICTAADMQSVDDAIEALRTCGSFAVPGFRNPEGIIVYHSASKQNYKVLLENDAVAKGQLALAA